MAVTEDLYEILQVEENAAPDAIRRAYYRLAKIYHPDLQSAEDSEATERFLSIQRAYQTLCNPTLRDRYNGERRRARKGSSASDEPEEEKSVVVRKATLDEERNARSGFMKAEELIEKGMVDKALRLMDAVVRTIPDHPEYMSLYGYALALNGEKLHKARDVCRRALEAEPYNTDFHAHLGYVYLRAGLKNTAVQSFEAALKGNPNHPVASAYLAEATDAGGLFSSLKSLFKRS